MKTKGLKLIAVALTGALLMGSVPADMTFYAAGEDTEYMEGVSISFSGGAHAAIGETVVLNDGDANTGLAVATQEAPLVADPEQTATPNEYANMAIAQVNGTLNVRAEANEDAEVVGKLYKNGAATVLETLDGWYKIESGSVVGYVSADYVIVGDETACKEASERVAIIQAQTLKLRKEASTESGVYTLISEGKKVTVLDESIEGWVKVKYKSYTGYVAAEYVELKTVYTYAESKEEEAARLAAEAEERRREEARRSSSNSNSNSNRTYNPPTGGTGQDVVNYAVQFVGNPYRLGGTSMTNGIDCSAFVMNVYAAFGVSLPRTSYDQRSVGYEVSADQIQPGDIVCYSGHVAIYIGDGKIVHASNRSDGIKISNNWRYTRVITIRRIF